MDIVSAKKRRDDLWADLDRLIKEKEPIMAKERAVREKIKVIQDQLYKAEMGVE